MKCEKKRCVKVECKNALTATTFHNTLTRDHISVTMKTKKMKVCKTPVTQSTARDTMTAETPKLVSTTHVNQLLANTMTTVVKIISVKRSTRKIQERISVKKSIVLLIMLANSTPTKNAKLVNVFVRRTSVNHKSVSSLNTAQE